MNSASNVVHPFLHVKVKVFVKIGRNAMNSKPYKGELHDWRKRPTQITDEPSLGYHIMAFPVGHPNFENWIITSPVISHNEETGEVETFNSLYKTVGPCLGTVTGKLSKSDFVKTSI